MEVRKVPVVYYLSRNGQLEHPHFLEVPLSPNSDGLYLRDVIHRLNQIRGRNMATSYSWSSKRSYKNGYVWQDLSRDDFIHPPAPGQEYILKGSELLHLENASSSSFSRLHHHHHGADLKVSKTSSLWSASGEYKVIKAGGGNDMGTQTGEEDRKGRRLVVKDGATELRREEVSPPSSSSSSTETLGMSGRLRVSDALMQLIACGSRSVKDGGSTGSARDIGMRSQSGRLSVDARDSIA